MVRQPQQYVNSRPSPLQTVSRFRLTDIRKDLRQTQAVPAEDESAQERSDDNANNDIAVEIHRQQHDLNSSLAYNKTPSTTLEPTM
jgi:hypothetical protein